MERYIGLDVHAQSCTLAVVSETGKRLKVQVVETNGEALVEAIRSVTGRRHLCIEEGVQSQWLYELLEPHVHVLVVIVPKGREGVKSDAADAWRMAEDLRRGAVDTVVYKAPQKFAGIRDAARGYGAVVRDVARTKTRLKAVFRSRGVAATGEEVYNPQKRASFLDQLPPASRKLAELLGEQLDALTPVRDRAEAWLHAEAKQHPIVRRLATAPALGPIRSAQLVAIVVTPHRFRTSRQFWSYCGLAIVTRSSADWERRNGKWIRSQIHQTRGLNRNRQPVLKSLFKGAATTIIMKMPEHPLHRDYQKLLAAGTKPNLAKLTIARRLAAIALAMWKKQEDYDPAKPHRHQTA